MDLIDCHVHTFANEADAREFMTHVRMPDADPVGTIDELVESRKGTPIVHTNIVFLPTVMWLNADLAAIPDDVPDRAAAEQEALDAYLARVDAYNRWTASVTKERPGFSYFCGVDLVRMTERQALEGVERWVADGAIGVKMAPVNMQLRGDDPRYVPIFDYCQEQGLPIVLASGAAEWAQPRWFADLYRQFPKTRIIMAHAAYQPEHPDAGLAELLDAMDGHPDVCADLSLRFDHVADGREEAEALVRIVREAGPERILFGSNFPLGKTGTALDVFEKLPLTAAERQLVGHDNFLRLTR